MLSLSFLMLNCVNLFLHKYRQFDPCCHTWFTHCTALFRDYALWVKTFWWSLNLYDWWACSIKHIWFSCHCWVITLCILLYSSHHECCFILAGQVSRSQDYNFFSVLMTKFLSNIEKHRCIFVNLVLHPDTWRAGLICENIVY